MPRFIEGTGGNKDYIVIGSKGRVVLGFKPVLQVAKLDQAGVFMGGRVRSAYDPEYQAPDGAAPVAIPRELVKAWPVAKFSNSDGTRASSLIGAFAPHRLPKDREALEAELVEHSVPDKLAKFIVGLVPEDRREITEAELRDHIAGVFTAEIAAHSEFAGGEDNVVDLQAAALKKLHKDKPTVH